MDEIRQRFLSKSHASDKEGRVKTQASAPTSSGGGSGSTGPSTIASTKVAPTSSKPTFTTRYLGRTNTPTVEAKEEEDESSEEEESSSSESEEEEKKVEPVAAARMEKTDIGPLLARSANERGNASTNYTNSKKESPPSVASYRRTRDSVSRVTSPPDRETSRYVAPTPSYTAPSRNRYGSQIIYSARPPSSSLASSLL